MEEDDEINASTARRSLGLATNATIYRYARQGLLSERVEGRWLRERRWYKRSEVEAMTIEKRLEAWYAQKLADGEEPIG